MSKALIKSTSLVSLMTFLSRLLGFARDMIVAQVFGVNASVDAFTAAFKIPNFMRGLFAEGSFSQAFVPVLSEYRHTRSSDEVKDFISHIAGSLGLSLLIITCLGTISAPYLIKLFAPGFDAYRFQLASEMLRVTFPYLLLISFTAFSGAILNSYGFFGVPSFTPVWLNVSLIVSALGAARYFSVPVEAQAWGVLVAGFLQFFFQWPFLYRLGFLVRPRLNWHNSGVQHVLRLMLPALFGASIGQISLLINTIFASFLKIGSVTWLYFSDRLVFFPLGVFGVALATVALPQLSKYFAIQSKEKFAHALNWGIRCNLLIGLPATITLSVLANQLIITLFYYGKFTHGDVLMTRRSVMAYSVGLLAFMLVKLLSSAFYAQKNVRTPVKIGIVVLVVNVILNVLLISPLQHAGLALASSLAAWFNVVLLVVTLHRLGVFQFESGWVTFLGRLLLANGLLSVFLLKIAGPANLWLAWDWQQRFLHLFIIGVASVVVYMASLFIFGLRWNHFKVAS